VSDFPIAGFFDGSPGVYISTVTALGMGGTQGVGASAAWPAANLAIFVPFRIARTVTVYKMATGAGATSAGNFDVGIYDAGGNRLVSSGATAKGNSVEHILNVTDTVIGPGLYYMAQSADGTNNYQIVIPSGTTPVPLQKVRLAGVLNAATSYVLPATVTFAAATNVAIPVIAAYFLPH